MFISTFMIQILQKLNLLWNRKKLLAMGNRKKIAKSLMRTFTCRSTFLYAWEGKNYQPALNLSAAEEISASPKLKQIWHSPNLTPSTNTFQFGEGRNYQPALNLSAAEEISASPKLKQIWSDTVQIYISQQQLKKMADGRTTIGFNRCRRDLS